MAKTKDTLNECFYSALALPNTTKVDDLTYEGHPSWDSIGHMRLIAAIESRFNISFSTDEILDISSYENACTLIEKHGVKIA